jgi:hypothetical protein
MTNHEIAADFAEIADILESQGANVFRVGAYRQAAENLRLLDRPVAALFAEQGTEGLQQLPGIGQSLAHSIEVLLRSGHLPLLERLRGDTRPERIFTTVADIGPKLARRIHDQLDIESLDELQAAANDGRLADVPGMGDKRIRAVRESLAGRFRHRDQEQRLASPRTPDEPAVAELLDVDAQYRRLAAQDRLVRIAPRRFNPGGQAWLPVLHTHRDDRHYTVLFSNSARAHELGTTQDWVVILLETRERHGQWTVITANYGQLRGRRIVRGREPECLAHYGL